MLNFRGEKWTGGKKSKDRVTVLVAWNQGGTDKLPLLVIGEYARPRCFRNSNMDLLPVIYGSQKNAWIDNVLFEKWLRQIDRRMKVANRHILLFLDNCIAHVRVNGLTNTKLIFFPPNWTRKLQPADQGIIQNLKVLYRQTMIRKMLQYLDEDKPIKAIDLKDAVFMMAKAWENVSATKHQELLEKDRIPRWSDRALTRSFESDEKDEETEESGGLWVRITHHCPSLTVIPFSHFVSVDTDIVTQSQPTEEEATREALEAVQSVECTTREEDEDSGDDNSVVDPEPLSPIEANKAVRALRDFIMTFDKSGTRER